MADNGLSSVITIAVFMGFTVLEIETVILQSGLVMVFIVCAIFLKYFQ
jgi:hypothetical protein